MAWTKGTWLGNDKPYAKATANIDRLIDEGKDLGDWFHKFHVGAVERPSDPLAQFRWLYFYYCLQGVPNAKYSEQDLINVVRDARKTQFPNTYSYARLLYLNSVIGWDMVPIGQRLLKMKPNDRAVKGKLAYDLLYTPGTDTRKLGMQYIQELCKTAKGKNAKMESQAALAFAAYAVWQHDKTHETQQEAIRLLTEYHKVAPPNLPFNKQVPMMINQINAEQAVADQQNKK